MITALLAGTVLAQTAGQYSTPKIELETYLDKKEAFAIEIPKAWTRKREEVDQDTFLTNFVGKDRRDGQIDVLTIWFEDELDQTATQKMDTALWPFVKSEIETWGKLLYDKSGEGKLSGKKGIRHDFSFETEDKTVYSGYVVITSGKHHVVMGRVYAEQSRRARFLEAETFLQTLNIEAKTPRKPEDDKRSGGG